MKKVILKLEWSEDKLKQKAMMTVSGIIGVESISMDTKDKTLTITGDIDAVTVVAKLRKLCYTEILSVGPAKEPEKKEEPKKVQDEKVDINQLMYAYQANPAYYGYKIVEQDPNQCVIC
ncbi:hypothetical protein Leryth_020297 [Lithospermum erythrorhizon]|nr:hypothetical protein Leryth_020297 [Lithospermum erythrorhizon]